MNPLALRRRRPRPLPGGRPPGRWRAALDREAARTRSLRRASAWAAVFAAARPSLAAGPLIGPTLAELMAGRAGEPGPRVGGGRDRRSGRTASGLGRHRRRSVHIDAAAARRRVPPPAGTPAPLRPRAHGPLAGRASEPSARLVHAPDGGRRASVSPEPPPSGGAPTAAPAPGIAWYERVAQRAAAQLARRPAGRRLAAVAGRRAGGHRAGAVVNERHPLAPTAVLSWWWRPPTGPTIAAELLRWIVSGRPHVSEREKVRPPAREQEPARPEPVPPGIPGAEPEETSRGAGSEPAANDRRPFHAAPLPVESAGWPPAATAVPAAPGLAPSGVAVLTAATRRSADATLTVAEPPPAVARRPAADEGLADLAEQLRRILDEEARRYGIET